MIIEWTYGTYYQQQRYAGLGLINNYSGLLNYTWSYDSLTGMVTVTTYASGTYIFGPIAGGRLPKLQRNMDIYNCPSAQN